MGNAHQAVVFNFGPGEENYYVIEEYLFKELLKHLTGGNKILYYKLLVYF